MEVLDFVSTGIVLQQETLIVNTDIPSYMQVAEILPVVSSKHQHEKQGLLWKRRKSRHAFKCSQCEETLDSKASLREHVRVQHQVERRVQCSFCEYVAPSPDYCLIHEKKIHLNLR